MNLFCGYIMMALVRDVAYAMTLDDSQLVGKYSTASI